MPEILFRYFWFVVAAVMVVNVLMWRHRLPALVAAGAVSIDESRRFLTIAATALVGTSLFLGVVSLVAGWAHPFCSSGMNFDNVPAALSSALPILEWFALLWWVWLGKGASLLGRVVSVFGRPSATPKQASPKSVRLVCTALVALSLAGALFNDPRAIPGAADANCAIT